MQHCVLSMILVVANASCPQTATSSFDIARKIGNYSCFSSTGNRLSLIISTKASSSSSVETRCPPELGRRSTVCSRLYFCTIKFTVLFGMLKVTDTYRCDIPLWIRPTTRDLLTIDTAGMLNKLIYFKVNLTVFSKISIMLTLKVHLHWHFLKWQEQTAQDSMSLIVWTRAGMSKFYWLALQASQLSDIFMLNTVTW